MTQVREIVRDALGHLGVIDANAPVNAIDMRDAIRALNIMMQRWAADGFVLSWQNVEDPTDEVDLSPQAEESAGFNLALRLRPRYRVTLEADVIAAASGSMLALWHDRITSIDVAGNTVAGLIRRALRLLGPVEPALIVGDPQLSSAIQALNQMMDRIEANGTAMGWSRVSSPGDPIPLPIEAREAIAAQLAVTIGPEYGVNPSVVLLEMARAGMSALARDRLVEMPLTLKSRLPRTGRYNIYIDDYNE